MLKWHAKLDITHTHTPHMDGMFWLCCWFVLNWKMIEYSLYWLRCAAQCDRKLSVYMYKILSFGSNILFGVRYSMAKIDERMLSIGNSKHALVHTKLMLVWCCWIIALPISCIHWGRSQFIASICELPLHCTQYISMFFVLFCFVAGQK